jgi:hypothetical protein
MADNWALPTGHEETDWSNPQYAYDGDTDFGATYLNIDNYIYTGYLTLTFDTIFNIDKVKVYSKTVGGELDIIELQYLRLSDTNWQIFKQGSFLKDQWEEYEIGSTVETNKIRIRYFNDSGVDSGVGVYGVEINIVPVIVNVSGKASLESEINASLSGFVIINATGKSRMFTEINVRLKGKQYDEEEDILFLFSNY